MTPVSFLRSLAGGVRSLRLKRKCARAIACWTWRAELARSRLRRPGQKEDRFAQLRQLLRLGAARACLIVSPRRLGTERAAAEQPRRLSSEQSGVFANEGQSRFEPVAHVKSATDYEGFVCLRDQVRLD
jgi:hypothetical protein